MKILIIQERGRHKENENFREALNMKRALLSIGIETEVWGLNYDNENIPFDTFVKEYDVILLFENYEINNWVPDLSKYTDKLKIFWSIDSHLNLHAHTQTVKKNNINITLNSIESDMAYFTYSKNYYFPNAYPDDLIYPMPEIKKVHNIGFVGGYGNRQEWIERLKTDFNLNENIFVIGKRMVELVNSFKINFNRNISNDVNYRTFETLGMKTFLLTNRTENIEKLFPAENKYLITYDDYQDLCNKIQYYLDHPSEREQIASDGYEFVKANHTYISRAKELLQIIKENI